MISRYSSLMVRRWITAAAAAAAVIGVTVAILLIQANNAGHVSGAVAGSPATRTPATNPNDPTGPSATRSDPKFAHGPDSAASTAPDGTVTYFGVGAVVSPTPAHAVPTVARQAALSTLAADELVTGITGKLEPPTSLKLVMYRNVLGTVHADGSMTPSVPNQLAWYAVYNNVPSNPISGPGNRPTTAVTNAPGTSCNLYVAVSATTGAKLDAYRICGRNLPN